jgi:hypothetical protein
MSIILQAKTPRRIFLRKLWQDRKKRQEYEIYDIRPRYSKRSPDIKIIYPKR